MSDNTNSTSHGPTDPCTMESLTRIMQWFDDRMPAVPVSISVHPDYLDLFKANLREAGFVRTSEPNPMVGLPVFVDGDVPEPWRVNYKGDK